jgi:hypothetical protein
MKWLLCATVNHMQRTYVITETGKPLERPESRYNADPQAVGGLLVTTKDGALIDRFEGWAQLLMFLGNLRAGIVWLREY